jgi:hypothetical protein
MQSVEHFGKDENINLVSSSHWWGEKNVFDTRLLKAS